MNTKQFRNCYDSLASAIATHAGCQRPERVQFIPHIRSNAAKLMVAIELAGPRVDKELIFMAERLVDKATSTVVSSRQT
jgi:hypothetical protein